MLLHLSRKHIIPNALTIGYLQLHSVQWIAAYRGAAAMNRMLLTIGAVALVAVPSFAQDTTVKDKLVGTWKVVTLKATSEGKVTHPLGGQVAGYVSITPRFGCCSLTRRGSRQPHRR